MAVKYGTAAGVRLVGRALPTATNFPDATLEAYLELVEVPKIDAALRDLYELSDLEGDATIALIADKFAGSEALAAYMSTVAPNKSARAEQLSKEAQKMLEEIRNDPSILGIDLRNRTANDDDFDGVELSSGDSAFDHTTKLGEKSA